MDGNGRWGRSIKISNNGHKEGVKTEKIIKLIKNKINF